MSDNFQAQEDELLALESIYSRELFVRPKPNSSGEIRVAVALPTDFSVTDKIGDLLRQHAISFLPPLVLIFDLPEDYPSASPPKFTLSSEWLSHTQLSAVCRHLDELWQGAEGSVVLYPWIQFLKEDLLSFLHIQPPLEVPVFSHAPPPIQPNLPPLLEPSQGGDSGACGGAECHGSLDPRAVPVFSPETDLVAGLLAYDERQRQREFEGQVFVCGVCFQGSPGSECVQFRECGHVYCDPCVAEYFRVQITAGNIQSLVCPESQCGSMATPAQVKKLVGDELFLRYDRLLLQSTLDRMDDVAYCPRHNCSSAVVLEPDRKAGICPACRYAFCSLCRRSYHGHAPCVKETTQEEAAQGRYLALPSDPVARQCLWDDYNSSNRKWKRVLEKRYGKLRLQANMVDGLSKEWMSQNSKLCPGCSSPIEKTGGCNHMSCDHCGTLFCWNCLAVRSEKRCCKFGDHFF